MTTNLPTTPATRYGCGAAAREMFEKLNFHLASVNVLTNQLRALGFNIEVGALTPKGNALLVLGGTKPLRDQITVKGK
jgi:hypothetical protein